MNKRSIPVVVAIAVAVLLAAIWYGARPQEAPKPLSTAIGKPSVEPGSTPTPATEPEKKQAAVQKQEPPAEMQKWEIQIDQALRSNVNETQTAQILIGMLPSLPEAGQVEAGHHISNLLPDEDFNRVMPTLLNPSTPEPVLSVFMTDLMNRSDPTKLHALLDVAKVANHPFHDEAMSTLQIFLGDDYGNDWAKWQAALDKYLAPPPATPEN